MSVNTVGELSLDEIPGDLIKKELIKLVKRRLNSNNVKISIERGSKKGYQHSSFNLIVI